MKRTKRQYRKKNYSVPKKTRPAISFIVSAHSRPRTLEICLATIALQTVSHEIIVCYNGPKSMLREHQKIADRFGAKLYWTGSWGAYCCYSSADMVIERGLASGDWLSFPSDDTVFFYCFSDIMVRAAVENRWDLVYCDMVYDPMNRVGEKGRYGILNVEPKYGRIDKMGFIVKRSWFQGFPGKRREGPTGSDGLLVEELVDRGIRHGKAPGVLLVHQ